MADSTKHSDTIMRAAGESLSTQRSGGRHRGAIGEHSKQLRRSHRRGKAKRIVAALAAVIIGAMIAGVIVDGIGVTGVIVALLAMVLAVWLFSAFPRMKVPKQADLNKGSVKQMVGNTELWLEHQRPALPPPAGVALQVMGAQLDTLSSQLEFVEPSHPAAHEIRALVGETLPETISAYRKIPANMRREKGSTGATPDEQLVSSLTKISQELDSVNRQLAAGSIDDLAIRDRYLDYKYGDGGQSAEDTAEDTGKDTGKQD